MRAKLIDNKFVFCIRDNETKMHFDPAGLGSEGYVEAVL